VGGTRPTTLAVAQYATFTDTAPYWSSPGEPVVLLTVVGDVHWRIQLAGTICWPFQTPFWR
jgi:hypothetical protein